MQKDTTNKAKGEILTDTAERKHTIGTWIYLASPIVKGEIQIISKSDKEEYLIATVHSNETGMRQAIGNAMLICDAGNHYFDIQQQNESLRKDIEGLQKENKRLLLERDLLVSTIRGIFSFIESGMELRTKAGDYAINFKKTCEHVKNRLGEAIKKYYR